MKFAFTIILIATSAYLASAGAKNNTKNVNAATSAPIACPAAHGMDQRHLQGTWRAELTGATASADAVLLHLGPHPEMAGSVRGTVQRGATTGQVAGDVHQGGLTLEESTDGKRISATWIGEVVDGSCGQEMRGTWHQVAPETSTPFVLRKQTAVPPSSSSSSSPPLPASPSL